MGLVSVYNAEDSLEANRIVDLLKDHSIESYSRDSGAGDYLRVTGNISFFGLDIIVDESDAKSARKLIREMRAADKEAEEEALAAEPEETDEEKKFIREYNTRVVATRLVIILLGVCSFLLMFFVYFISNFF